VGRKILVVEDESLSRKNLSQLLHAEGYDVVEASNGSDALKLFEEERFDLVITDLMLPQIDGLTLADTVGGVWPNTPVLLMTGYLSIPSQKVRARMPELISKPVDFEELLRKVGKLIGRHPNLTGA